MASFTIRIDANRAPVAGVFVRKLTGREAISEVYRFEVDVVCAASTGLPKELAPNALVSLVFVENDLDVRRIHGFVLELDAELEVLGDHHAYRLVVVPRLHQLTLGNYPSVYVNATVEQMLEAEFALQDFEPARDYTVNLDWKPPARALMIQHDETDFGFVSRLTEHYGISYLFDELDGHERVVFTNHLGGFPHCENAEEVVFNSSGSTSRVYALTESTRLIPSVYQVTDYNYRQPQLELGTEHLLQGDGLAGNSVEGNTNTMSPDEATMLAQIRAEEQHCRQLRYRGKSTLATFSAGHRTTLTEHARLGESGRAELLLIEVVHTAELATPWQPTTVSSYKNEFVAVPAARTFRPARRTPRPRMPSVVTGRIMPLSPGASSEAAEGSRPVLDTDGSYEVRFHFDLEKGRQRTRWSSPVRMAQPFEGGSYGMHFPLRPGTEVLIAFENGDPDRPIIIGALPNAIQPSPVTSTNANFHRLRSPNGIVVEFGALETKEENAPS